jgi:hypothetical protein
MREIFWSTRSIRSNHKYYVICWSNFESSFSSIIKTSRIMFNDLKWQCKTFERRLSMCRLMIIFSFCIFIWILMRSLNNIASITLRFMKSCRTNRIWLKTSITRSIDFWISASIARSRKKINACHDRHYFRFKLIFWQNSIKRVIKD